MTTPHKALLIQARDALRLSATPLAKDRQEVLQAIAALQAAIDAPEPEPVAYRFPKAGVDNGYNYCDSLDGEEPRFLKSWEKLYAAAKFKE